jgi:hypothetical protein
MKATDVKTDDEITVEGNCIDEFEEDDNIIEVILLGEFGGVRRILLK